MSHLVPVRDYSGSPDPIAAIHAARLERQRRLAAAAYVPPKAEPKPAEQFARPAPRIVPFEEVLARYRLIVDTFDPLVNMSGLATIRPPRPAWPAAVAIVCRETGVSCRDLQSRRRARRVAHCRHLALWLMRECTKLSLPAIGRTAGDYDHTTVLHACNQVVKRRVASPEFREATSRMREELIGLLA